MPAFYALFYLVVPSLLSLDTHTHTHTRTHARTHIHTRTHARTYTHTRTHARMRTHAHTQYNTTLYNTVLYCLSVEKFAFWLVIYIHTQRGWKWRVQLSKVLSSKPVAGQNRYLQASQRLRLNLKQNCPSRP